MLGQVFDTMVGSGSSVKHSLWFIYFSCHLPLLLDLDSYRELLQEKGFNSSKYFQIFEFVNKELLGP